MEHIRFNYSLKNIPISSKDTYLKKLIEKVASVIKRMRGKVFFFERDNEEEQNEKEEPSNKFGFKSGKCPPQNQDMEKFEEDLLGMIKNIKFRKANDEFQRTLRKDIRTINNSPKAFISADKTANMHELDKVQYDKLLHDSITSTYKKADEKVFDAINEEAKGIATKLDIEDRTE